MLNGDYYAAVRYATWSCGGRSGSDPSGLITHPGNTIASRTPDMRERRTAGLVLIGGGAFERCPYMSEMQGMPRSCWPPLQARLLVAPTLFMPLRLQSRGSISWQNGAVHFDAHTDTICEQWEEFDHESRSFMVMRRKKVRSNGIIRRLVFYTEFDGITVLPCWMPGQNDSAWMTC